MDVSVKIVQAKQTNGKLIGPTGATLTPAEDLDKTIKRQLKFLNEGNIVVVKVEGTVIVGIVKDDEKDKRDSAAAAKTLEIESFRKLLRGKLAAKIQAKTKYHELPDGEDRLHHLFRNLKAQKEDIISAASPTFQMWLPAGSKTLVTGYWEVVDGELQLSINHYGEGSPY